MKKQALFSISATTVQPNQVKQMLSDTYAEQIEQLCSRLKQQLGQIKSLHIHPYRIGLVNYIKVRFEGEKETLYLLLELSGYLNLPDFTMPFPTQLHIRLNDATDGYWLIKLLQNELFTDTVDNPV